MTRPASSRSVRTIGVTSLIGLLALTAGLLALPVRLTWNATPSVPIGLYAVSKPTLARGELVLADAPPPARQVASERRYLPDGAHLAKRIFGVSGDKICAESDTIFVNGAPLAQRQMQDTKGRDMPSWGGCRVLDDEVFLLLPEVATSFDGRYFGPIPTSAVIGKMTPLWTR